ncbi:MAG: hypothetical protein KF744_00850 [Taibaiella sp.]|nr:hypothetical protein [Taibaiella sp.]
MNTRSNISISSPAAGTPFSRFFGKIARYVRHLFEPEEVEVTFHVEGKHVTYTYTKVEEKQVA